MAGAAFIQNETRQARVARMWDRFCRLMLAEGLGSPEYRAAITSCTGRCNHMRYWLRRGKPEGWYFESRLEAADVRIENVEESRREGCPTGARPGSREKLAALADRARAGQPLWHPGDYLGDE